MSSDSAPSLFAAWTRTSSQLFKGLLEANRAAAAAFGLPPGSRLHDEDGAETDGSSEPDADFAPENVPAEVRVPPGGTLAGWDVEVDVVGEELAVGDSVRFSKTLSEADVARFAAASGDTNPLHLDESFAEDTRFGERIAHGTLVSGLISAALARLPGSVIYLSQDAEFLSPVSVGDRVTADVEVVEDLGSGRYRLATRVLDADGETVIDGEAVVLID